MKQHRWRPSDSTSGFYKMGSKRRQTEGVGSVLATVPLHQQRHELFRIPATVALHKSSPKPHRVVTTAAAPTAAELRTSLAIFFQKLLATNIFHRNACKTARTSNITPARIHG